MPTLLEYINKLQREHRYRIKMAFAPTDQQLETLERHMKKYDALEVGRPEKLMLQSNPMDFPQLGAREIVIIDVVTRLPISPPMLENELRGLLMIANGILKVFGRDEPVEQEIEATAKDGEYAAKIGSDYTVAEANAVCADDAAGDKYNQALLDAVNKADAERKESITQKVGKITTGPDFKGPSDGNKSPMSKITNPLPTAKGTRK